MPSKPDLGMHTLTHFLDRFVYRAAKSSAATGAAPARGASIMQPLDGGDTRGMVLSTRAAGKAQVPVNSDAFWRRRVEDVPVDEVFFHKYFNQAAPKKTVAAEKKKTKDAAAADSEEEEEANEEEIWKAMVGSRPELGGAEMDSGDEGADFDDDEDMDLDDIEDEDEDEEEGGVVVDEDDGSDVPDFGGDDEDDVWSDDDDVPDALDKAFEAELQSKTKAEVEAEGEKEQPGNDRRKKRRKLKNLPTFASAEDYAHMLSD